MKLRRRSSMLHLQMGQETIYLLLVGSLFACVCLISYVMRLKGPQEQPPILTLRETSGFSFAAGSSAINPRFRAGLAKEIIPKLRDEAKRHDTYIIEVIGHTDEVPVQSSVSNLDRTLLPWLSGRGAGAQAGDNVGLGMTRAVAVARVLRTSGLGDPFVIIPLSAGPVLRPGEVVSDGSTTGDDQDRRRIELRLRQPVKPSAEEAGQRRK